VPVIGFLSGRSLGESTELIAAFRQGLSEAGYVEGRSVLLEYQWTQGQYDRLPALASDLVARRVAVIVTTGGTASAVVADRIAGLGQNR
jgi:putative ABC transport system substrate-binding protein